MGRYNCLLKLKGHHWGNLVTTVPRLVGAARTRACGATVGGGRIRYQQPESDRRDEHMFDLRGNGGWEPNKWRHIHMENPFLGNKLPENVIFPSVELCLHLLVLPPERQVPNKKGGWTALTKSNLPHPPQLDRTCRLPIHPVNSRLNLLLNKYKPT